MRTLIILCLCLGASLTNAQGCTPSPTTASGTRAPGGQICSGQLIFEDNFDTLDQGKWRHENSLSGGGNWVIYLESYLIFIRKLNLSFVKEFQWYVNDRSNSYTSASRVHFRPTMTSDIFGEGFLSSGRVQIPADQCTQAQWYGCDRQGTPDNIINPIRSARLGK